MTVTYTGKDDLYFVPNDNNADIILQHAIPRSIYIWVPRIGFGHKKVFFPELVY